MSGDQFIGNGSDGVSPSELPPAPTWTLRREWGDLLVGIALIAAALWFFVTAGALEDFSGEAIGAADFPQGIAVLLVLGVIALILGAVRRIASGGERHVVVIRRYGHVALGMVLLVSFPFLMGTFGFYAAMTPWLAAMLVLAGERRPVHVVGYVAGFLLFTKVVFEMTLGTPLP